MRYFLMVWAAMAAALSLFLPFYVGVRLCRKRAYHMVALLTAEEKLLQINESLAPFGFVYEPQGDLLLLSMYPWRRELGYCRQYDEKAPSMLIVCERELIYFTFDKKRYLIELSKGQYGCAMGAEIGIYVNKDSIHGERQEGLFYQCAGDEERLDMRLVLYNGNDIVIDRQGLHWCLAGYLPGKYGRPEELTVRACITLTDHRMRDAFYEGLLNAGYEPAEITVKECDVAFLFDRPHSKQSVPFSKTIYKLVCCHNRRGCRKYCQVTACMQNNLDKITYLEYCAPFLYWKILRIGTKRNGRRLRRYGKNKDKW